MLTVWIIVLDCRIPATKRGKMGKIYPIFQYGDGIYCSNSTFRRNLIWPSSTATKTGMSKQSLPLNVDVLHHPTTFLYQYTILYEISFMLQSNSIDSVTTQATVYSIIKIWHIFFISSFRLYKNTDDSKAHKPLKQRWKFQILTTHPSSQIVSVDQHLFTSQVCTI